MTHTELYITWAGMAVIFLAIGSLAKSVQHAREEIEEFRQYMMGEKAEDPDSLG